MPFRVRPNYLKNSSTATPTPNSSVEHQMDPVVVIDRAELGSELSARLWALVLYLAKHPDDQHRSQFRSFWLARGSESQGSGSSLKSKGKT